MPPSPSGQDTSGDYVLYVFLLMGLFLGVGIFYEANKEGINFVIMMVDKVELYLFSWIPFLDEPARVMSKVAWNQPKNYTWDQVMLITEITGKYIRFPFAGIVIWLLIRSYKNHGVAERYTTVHSMQSLVQHNVHGFPCMAPVAYRNLLDEHYDKGPWRIARTPLQWIAENGLIVDKNNQSVPKEVFIHPVTGFADIKSPVLRNGKNKEFKIDKKRCKELLIEQLGTPFTCIEDMPEYMQALAVCFMAFIAGEKEKGQQFLDHMSLSFVEGTEEKDMADMKIDIHGWEYVDKKGKATGQRFKDLLKKYRTNEYVLYATQYHSSYNKVWMMALLGAARKKGVLASSQFIWLRPTNRGLWYALNQVGGSTAWAEATGPWAHSKIEDMAKMSLHEPEVDQAVDGFEYAIKMTGFLFNPDLK